MNARREMDYKQNNPSRKVRLDRSSTVLYTTSMLIFLQVPRMVSKLDPKTVQTIAVSAKELCLTMWYTH